MNFQEKIKALRIEKGMTLEEVGQKVGVGKSTVRKWESGDIKNMRRDKIANLAFALGVSPAYLMGWTDDPSIDVAQIVTEPDVVVSRIPPHERQLLDTFRQLNPEGQDKVVSYADDLLSSGRYIKTDPIPWAERA